MRTLYKHFIKAYHLDQNYLPYNSAYKVYQVTDGLLKSATVFLPV